MDGFIESLHAALGQGQAVVAPARNHRAGGEHDINATCTNGQRARDDRAIARELAALLDRAMNLNQWAHAERIAHTAARLTRDHPILAERLARLRAARGEFEIALTIIDSCITQPASMRLLRAICLLQLGRRHEAHLDLHEWSRRSSAPLHARLILALLELDEGDDEAAAIALQRNLRQIEDPHTLAALLLMAVSRGRSTLAGLWARRLRAAIASHPSPALFHTMLAACGFAQREAGVPDSPAAAATLATELIGNEHLLPALVEAQRLEGDHAAARLLINALRQAVDELDDPCAACAALADLYVMLGEREVAAAWRGRTGDLEPQRDDVLASIGRGGVARPANDVIVSAENHDAAQVWEAAA